MKNLTSSHSSCTVVSFIRCRFKYYDIMVDFYHNNDIFSPVLKQSLVFSRMNCNIVFDMVTQ